MSRSLAAAQRGSRCMLAIGQPHGSYCTICTIWRLHACAHGCLPPPCVRLTPIESLFGFFELQKKGHNPHGAEKLQPVSCQAPAAAAAHEQSERMSLKSSPEAEARVLSHR
jgi:hypothetical protein